MKNKKREITLLVLGILIVIVATLRISSAYMRPSITTEGPTEITLNNCAKLNLIDETTSINMTNTAPMTDNVGLLQTPYKFNITSSCESSIRFKIYLAPMPDNTLSASHIKYAIKERATSKVLATGKLTEESISEFNDSEKTEINNSLGTTITSVYTIFANYIIAGTEKNFELYLWVDETAGNEVKNQTFSAAVLAKGGEDFVPTLADVCQGQNMASCFKENYTLDKSIYYHNETLENGAGDNSYRYAGAHDTVNNFVCFGTDAESCPNDNLYRIIGVFDNQVKLIKYDYATKEQLGTGGDYYLESTPNTTYYKGSQSKVSTYYWNNVNGTSSKNNWNESRLNTIHLNSTYLNNLGTTWTDKIATTTWNVGGMSRANGMESNAKTAYDYEVGANKINKTYEAKIGLMYLSEYYYGALPNHWTKPGYDNDTKQDYRTAVNDNWMHMGHSEWTISPYTNNTTNVFFVNLDGYVYNGNVYYFWGVRPTFNLILSVKLVGGFGTKGNPYRIV